MRVGVVVPAFRPDPTRLGTYVRELAERFSVARVEVDEPRPVVEERLASLPCEVGVAADRRGKGAAITGGFETLADRVDVLAFADADGSTPGESVADVVGAVEGGADLGVGSRRHPAADVRSHQTLARRRLGDVFAWLARRLLATDLYDYQCGAKALTAPTWAAVRDHLYEPGFAWDVELVAMAAALDRTVAEVPIIWEDRPGSTVSPVRTSLSMATALFVARHRAKRLGNSPLHDAIARGEEPTALVERGSHRRR